MAASRPSHLLSDVPILLSHGGTTDCKWPKSSHVGGPSVTCSVTQQPTDAIMEKQKKQKGGLSTGKHDVLILWFQGYAAGQVSIVILSKQVGQNGNYCFLGQAKVKAGLETAGAAACSWALRPCAVRGSLLPTDRGQKMLLFGGAKFHPAQVGSAPAHHSRFCHKCRLTCHCTKREVSGRRLTLAGLPTPLLRTVLLWKQHVV